MEQVKLVISEMIINHSKEVRGIISEINEQFSKTQALLKDEMITHLEQVNAEQTFKIMHETKNKHEESLNAINNLKQDIDQDYSKLVSDLSSIKEELSNAMIEFSNKISKDRSETHLNFK